MKKIIRSIASGIAMGCTIFVFIGIFISIANNTDNPFIAQYGFIQQALSAIVVGIGFSLPSLVYDNQKLSQSVQALIHLSIGFTMFGIVAIYAKWIPVTHGNIAMLWFFSTAFLSTIAIWYCFYLYYKKEAKKINRNIKEKQAE